MLRRLTVLLLPALVVFGLSGARAATDEHAADFVARVNAERVARGLPRYAVRSDLAAVAARHSARMAAGSSLHHNPRLGSEVSGWQAVGENVGNGGSVASIHAAFMDSPMHRANVLAKDFTEIGVGTVTDDDGLLWVTQVFRLPARAPAAARPATREAARTAVRPPARTPVVAARPARPARPAAPAPVPVAERPDPAAFAGALAPSPAEAAGDPFGRAMTYATALAAFTR